MKMASNLKKIISSILVACILCGMVAFAAADDQTAVYAAKTAAAGATYGPTTQAAVNSAAVAKTLVEQMAATAVGDSSITVTANEVSFTAAAAGTVSDINGTNGMYTFTITAVKSGKTATTGNLSLTITATAYVPVETLPLSDMSLIGNTNSKLMQTANPGYGFASDVTEYDLYLLPDVGTVTLNVALQFANGDVIGNSKVSVNGTDVALTSADGNKTYTGTREAITVSADADIMIKTTSATGVDTTYTVHVHPASATPALSLDVSKVSENLYQVVLSAENTKFNTTGIVLKLDAAKVAMATKNGAILADGVQSGTEYYTMNATTMSGISTAVYGKTAGTVSVVGEAKAASGTEITTKRELLTFYITKAAGAADLTSGIVAAALSVDANSGNIGDVRFNGFKVTPSLTVVSDSEGVAVSGNMSFNGGKVPQLDGLTAGVSQKVGQAGAVNAGYTVEAVVGQKAGADVTERNAVTFTVTKTGETKAAVSITLFDMSAAQNADFSNVTVKISAASAAAQELAYEFSGVPAGEFKVIVSKKNSTRGEITGIVVSAEDISLPTINCAAGDLNGDNLINSDDLGQVSSNFNKPNVELDLNDDGLVNSDDSGLIAGAFNMEGVTIKK